jgi:hypothetical protein
MGILELWRRTDPDPAHRWQPPRVGEAGAPGGRGRFEVRVCRREATWEVRPGIDGPVHAVRSEAQARKQARELARVAWADDGLLSCVKVLSSDGTWIVEEIYGMNRPAA